MNYIDIGPIRTEETYDRLVANLIERGFIANNLLVKPDQLPKYIFVGCASFIPCYRCNHKKYSPKDLFTNKISPRFKLPSFREKSASTY